MNAGRQSTYSPNTSAESVMTPMANVRSAVRAAIRRPVFATFMFSSAMCSTVLAQSPAVDALEEVTVSATRRDTTTLEVPYSISVISGQALENGNVASTADLMAQIPGVSFVDQGPLSMGNIVLRGINSNATNRPSRSTVAPVSTYIGETPIFIPMQIADLERVEVLRGPQGTLYGSGSLSGTIRYIPKAPDLAGWGGYVDGDIAQVQVGKDFDKRVTGALNIPISDTLAARVSAGYTHWAGFIDENYIVKLDDPSTASKSPVGIPVSGDGSLLGPMVFTPMKNVNETDQSNVRTQLLFKPSEELRVLLTYYHQSDIGKGAQAHSPDFVGSVDATPAQNPFYTPDYPVSYPTGGYVFPHNEDYDANNSFVLRMDRRTDLYSADTSYDFGFASLSSDTAYYDDHYSSISDATGVLTRYPTFYGFIPRMVDFSPSSGYTRSLTEELRLVSKSGKHVDYVLGAFYQRQLTRSLSKQFVPGQTFFGTLVGAPGENADAYGDLNADSDRTTRFYDRALFGEVTGHITERLDITGGFRQFWQDYRISGYGAFPYCGSACDNAGGTYGSTAADAGYNVSDNIKKLNASYRFSPNLNTYVTYSEGFRRGGSNSIPISGPFAASPALLIYDPDKTKNYEAGVKGRVAGVNFSAAVFYIDWDNFQVDVSAAAGGGSGAVNGASAESKGVELELSGTLIPRLTYDLGYSYAKAEISKDFTIFDTNQYKEVVAIAKGTKGDPLPNAPRSSFTGAVDYSHPAPLLSGWDMQYHVNWSYRSSTVSQLPSANPRSPKPFKIDSFWKANVAVGVAKDNFSTALYVDNVFNTLGMTGGADAGTAGLRAASFYITRPRTIGVKAGYSF